MKHIFYISLLFVAASCKTVKSSLQTTTHAVDTFYKASVDFTIKERIIRDTVIHVKERVVRDTILKEDLQIRSVVTGQKKPVLRQKTNSGLTAWVSVDTSGNITYGATSDSFALVIKGLVHERDSAFTLLDKRHIKERLFDKKTTKTKERWTLGGWLLNNLYWIFPLAVMAVFIFKKLSKWTL